MTDNSHNPLNILLIGEYSGLHNNLKQALQRLGHRVTLIADGDFFKNFPADLPLRRPGRSSFFESNKLLKVIYRTTQKVATYFWLTEIIRSISHYDVIQFINYRVFYSIFERRLIKEILTKHPCVILLGAGCDYDYKTYSRLLPYSPCATCVSYDQRWYARCKHGDTTARDIQNLFSTHAKAILPTAYDYSYTLLRDERARHVVRDIIPFPVPIDSYRQHEVGEHKKIVFFHPENREGFKGTHLIRRVFERLSSERDSNAAFIIRGKMSFPDYLNFTDTVDVLVDQIYSQTYGMAATIALAQGKIVLSGMEDRAREASPHLRACPVINIRPTEEDIYDAILSLITLPRADLRLIGQHSRTFAANVHDAIHVARQYENIYYECI